MRLQCRIGGLSAETVTGVLSLHPDLWTLPGVGWTVHSWGVLVAAGFLLGVGLSVVHAKRAGCEPGVITSIALVGGVLGFVGARGMHVLHYYWRDVRSGQLGLKEAITLGSGQEVMGGVLLGIAGVVVYLLLVRKSLRLYLDVLMPALILGMGVGRIGCFENGCCWGRICEIPAGERALPWAVRFPYGSRPYLAQWAREELSIPAELLWMPPDRKAREPIPSSLLANDALERDEHIARYLDSLEARAARANSANAGAARDRDEIRRLQAELPGENSDEQRQYAAAALHLRRLPAPASGGQVHMADLRALAAVQHSHWVHPTQLYDAAGLILLSALLSVVLARRVRHGMVVAMTMLLYPISRFAQEWLRADNPHDVGGLTISQGLSLAVFACGVVFLIVLSRTRAADVVAVQPA